MDISERRIAVVGAGAAGLAFTHLAARAGARVALFEKHSLPGGCASWFKRTTPVGAVQFDAGATVLNALSPGFFLRRFHDAHGLTLPRYHRMREMRYSLGGRRLTLRSESPEAWVESLVQSFPRDSALLRRHLPPLGALSRSLDRALGGIAHLPLEAPADFLRNLRLARGLAPALPWLLRGGLHSFGEILDQWNPSPEFRAWVEMNLLITLQAPTSEVHPLWGALGIFFYALDAGALDGGMRGLFENSLRAAQAHARVRVFMRTPVSALRWRDNRWLVETPDGARGPFDLVVSAIPRWNTERLLGSEGAVILGPRARWDEVAPRLWGAIVAYAVVRDDASFPEAPFNHHSRLEEDPLDGGEAYMSFSRRGDLERAPEGYRTVTISSHTRLRAWQNFPYVGRGVRKRLAPGAPVPDPEYVVARDAAGERLIRHLENAYPGVEIVFREFGTPRTFERYTGRREGSVGGIPMTRDFTLFNSLPLRTRHERLWQIGDTSFPGQSVYACTLGACAAFEQMSGRRPDWLA